MKMTYTFQHMYTGKIRNVRLDEAEYSRDSIEDDDPQSRSERWDIEAEKRQNYRRVARRMKQKGYRPLDV